MVQVGYTNAHTYVHRVTKGTKVTHLHRSFCDKTVAHQNVMAARYTVVHIPSKFSRSSSQKDNLKWECMFIKLLQTVLIKLIKRKKDCLKSATWYEADDQLHTMALVVCRAHNCTFLFLSANVLWYESMQQTSRFMQLCSWIPSRWRLCQVPAYTTVLHFSHISLSTHLHLHTLLCVQHYINNWGTMIF